MLHKRQALDFFSNDNISASYPTDDFCRGKGDALHGLPLHTPVPLQAPRGGVVLSDVGAHLHPRPRHFYRALATVS